MIGLEDPSRQFMSYRSIPPSANNSVVTGRSVAPSVTECHPCGGQNGGQVVEAGQCLVPVRGPGAQDILPV
jgi:hypothetical protein